MAAVTVGTEEDESLRLEAGSEADADAEAGASEIEEAADVEEGKATGAEDGCERCSGKDRMKEITEQAFAAARWRGRVEDLATLKPR